ncbi:MAG: 1-(5-phosphoribosyl)-5-[(5-phosphoribosylamino)methylideneamino]imidazole-4-carboxamide isomerase [Thermomicrobiales bacterium]
MLVIPAIDIRGGRCVQLVQGDYDRERVFGDDPLAVAARWQAAGARRIHIVDLEGARDGVGSQHGVIGSIARHVDIPIQVGGGIRSVDDARSLLESGVDRVILGTAAIKEPDLISRLIDKFGAASIVLGIDARAGYVATDGWRETSSISALDLLSDMRGRGVERVVYTDIERDGMLTSPNFEATAGIAASGVAVIASGGVARREDLARLAAIDGVEAAIVGTAMYTGDIDLGPDEWDWSAGARTEGSAP